MPKRSALSVCTIFECLLSELQWHSYSELFSQSCEVEVGMEHNVWATSLPAVRWESDDTSLTYVLRLSHFRTLNNALLPLMLLCFNHHAMQFRRWFPGYTVSRN